MASKNKNIQIIVTSKGLKEVKRDLVSIRKLTGPGKSNSIKVNLSVNQQGFQQSVQKAFNSIASKKIKLSVNHTHLTKSLNDAIRKIEARGIRLNAATSVTGSNNEQSKSTTKIAGSNMVGGVAYQKEQVVAARAATQAQVEGNNLTEKLSSTLGGLNQSIKDLGTTTKAFEKGSREMKHAIAAMTKVAHNTEMTASHGLKSTDKLVKSRAGGNKISMQVARQAALTNKNLERLIRGLLHLEIATKKKFEQPIESAQLDLKQMASRAHTRRGVSTGMGMAPGFDPGESDDLVKQKERRLYNLNKSIAQAQSMGHSTFQHEKKKFNVDKTVDAQHALGSTGKLQILDQLDNQRILTRSRIKSDNAYKIANDRKSDEEKKGIKASKEATVAEKKHTNAVLADTASLKNSTTDKSKKGQQAASRGGSPVAVTGGNRKVDTYARNRGIIGTKGGGGDFSHMASGMGGFVGMYAEIAAKTFALGAAFRALKEAADFGVLINGMKAYEASSGASLLSVAHKVKELTQHTVGLKQASQSVTIATAAGFDSSQIEAMATAATNAGMALGRDLGDSLERVIKGVTKAEPELLDELGIILRLETASKKYAKTLGKSVKDLTTFEKQQAVLNEVLDQADKKFGLLGDRMEGKANPFTKLSASIMDAVLKLGNDSMDWNMFFGVGSLKDVVGFMSENSSAVMAAMAGLGGFLLSGLMPKISKFNDSYAKKAEGIVKTNKIIQRSVEEDAREGASMKDRFGEIKTNANDGEYETAISDQFRNDTKEGSIGRAYSHVTEDIEGHKVNSIKDSLKNSGFLEVDRKGKVKSSALKLETDQQAASYMQRELGGQVTAALKEVETTKAKTARIVHDGLGIDTTLDRKQLQDLQGSYLAIEDAQARAEGDKAVIDRTTEALKKHGDTLSTVSLKPNEGADAWESAWKKSVKSVRDTHLAWRSASSQANSSIAVAQTQVQNTFEHEGFIQGRGHAKSRTKEVRADIDKVIADTRSNVDNKSLTKYRRTSDKILRTWLRIKKATVGTKLGMVPVAGAAKNLTSKLMRVLPAVAVLGMLEAGVKGLASAFGLTTKHLSKNIAALEAFGTELEGQSDKWQGYKDKLGHFSSGFVGLGDAAMQSANSISTFVGAASKVNLSVDFKFNDLSMGDHFGEFWDEYTFWNTSRAEAVEEANEKWTKSIEKSGHLRELANSMDFDYKAPAMSEGTGTFTVDAQRFLDKTTEQAKITRAFSEELKSLAQSYKELGTASDSFNKTLLKSTPFDAMLKNLEKVGKSLEELFNSAASKQEQAKIVFAVQERIDTRVNKEELVSSENVLPSTPRKYKLKYAKDPKLSKKQKARTLQELDDKTGEFTQVPMFDSRYEELKGPQRDVYILGQELKSRIAELAQYASETAKMASSTLGGTSEEAEAAGLKAAKLLTKKFTEEAKELRRYKFFDASEISRILGENLKEQFSAEYVAGQYRVNEASSLMEDDGRVNAMKSYSGIDLRGSFEALEKSEGAVDKAELFSKNWRDATEAYTATVKQFQEDDRESQYRVERLTYDKSKAGRANTALGTKKADKKGNSIIEEKVLQLDNKIKQLKASLGTKDTNENYDAVNRTITDLGTKKANLEETKLSDQLISLKSINTEVGRWASTMNTIVSIQSAELSSLLSIGARTKEFSISTEHLLKTRKEQLDVSKALAALNAKEAKEAEDQNAELKKDITAKYKLLKLEEKRKHLAKLANLDRAKDSQLLARYIEQYQTLIKRAKEYADLVPRMVAAEFSLGRVSKSSSINEEKSRDRKALLRDYIAEKKVREALQKLALDDKSIVGSDDRKALLAEHSQANKHAEDIYIKKARTREVEQSITLALHHQTSAMEAQEDLLSSREKRQEALLASTNKQNKAAGIALKKETIAHRFKTSKQLSALKIANLEAQRDSKGTSSTEKDILDKKIHSEILSIESSRLEAVNNIVDALREEHDIRKASGELRVQEELFYRAREAGQNYNRTDASVDLTYGVIDSGQDAIAENLKEHGTVYGAVGRERFENQRWKDFGDSLIDQGAEDSKRIIKQIIGGDMDPSKIAKKQLTRLGRSNDILENIEDHLDKLRQAAAQGTLTLKGKADTSDLKLKDPKPTVTPTIKLLEGIKTVSDKLLTKVGDTNVLVEQVDTSLKAILNSFSAGVAKGLNTFVLREKLTNLEDSTVTSTTSAQAPVVEVSVALADDIGIAFDAITKKLDTSTASSQKAGTDLVSKFPDILAKIQKLADSVTTVVDLNTAALQAHTTGMQAHTTAVQANTAAITSQKSGDVITNIITNNFTGLTEDQMALSEVSDDLKIFTKLNSPVGDSSADAKPPSEYPTAISDLLKNIEIGVIGQEDAQMPGGREAGYNFTGFASKGEGQAALSEAFNKHLNIPEDSILFKNADFFLQAAGNYVAFAEGTGPGGQGLAGTTDGSSQYILLDKDAQSMAAVLHEAVHPLVASLSSLGDLPDFSTYSNKSLEVLTKQAEQYKQTVQHLGADDSTRKAERAFLGALTDKYESKDVIDELLVRGVTQNSLMAEGTKPSDWIPMEFQEVFPAVVAEMDRITALAQSYDSEVFRNQNWNSNEKNNTKTSAVDTTVATAKVVEEAGTKPDGYIAGEIYSGAMPVVSSALKQIDKHVTNVGSKVDDLVFELVSTLEFHVGLPMEDFMDFIFEDMSPVLKKLGPTLDAITRALTFRNPLEVISDQFKAEEPSVKLATGGNVRGPGGPKEDLIPALLSNGEYVINAASTKKHEPLIRAINEDNVSQFMSGGKANDDVARFNLGGMVPPKTNTKAAQAIYDGRFSKGSEFVHWPSETRGMKNGIQGSVRYVREGNKIVNMRMDAPKGGPSSAQLLNELLKNNPEITSIDPLQTTPGKKFKDPKGYGINKMRGGGDQSLKTLRYLAGLHGVEILETYEEMEDRWARESKVKDVEKRPMSRKGASMQSVPKAGLLKTAARFVPGLGAAITAADFASMYNPFEKEYTSVMEGYGDKKDNPFGSLNLKFADGGIAKFMSGGPVGPEGSVGPGRWVTTPKGGKTWQPSTQAGWDALNKSLKNPGHKGEKVYTNRISGKREWAASRSDLTKWSSDAPSKHYEWEEGRHSRINMTKKKFSKLTSAPSQESGKMHKAGPNFNTSKGGKWYTSADGTSKRFKSAPTSGKWQQGMKWTVEKTPGSAGQNRSFSTNNPYGTGKAKGLNMHEVGTATNRNRVVSILNQYDKNPDGTRKYANGFKGVSDEKKAALAVYDKIMAGKDPYRGRNKRKVHNTMYDGLVKKHARGMKLAKGKHMENRIWDRKGPSMKASTGLGQFGKSAARVVPGLGTALSIYEIYKLLNSGYNPYEEEGYISVMERDFSDKKGRVIDLGPTQGTSAITGKEYANGGMAKKFANGGQADVESSIDNWSTFAGATVAAKIAEFVANMKGIGQGWLPNGSFEKLNPGMKGSSGNWWKAGSNSFGLKGSFMGAKPTMGGTLGLAGLAGWGGFELGRKLSPTADNYWNEEEETGYSRTKSMFGLANGGMAKKYARFAHGGLAGMGRNGDTELAHVNPEESKVLKSMGGSGSINPKTGLREYSGGGKAKMDIQERMLGVYEKTLENAKQEFEKKSAELDKNPDNSLELANQMIKLNKSIVDWKAKIDEIKGATDTTAGLKNKQIGDLFTVSLKSGIGAAIKNNDWSNLLENVALSWAESIQNAYVAKASTAAGNYVESFLKADKKSGDTDTKEGWFSSAVSSVKSFFGFGDEGKDKNKEVKTATETATEAIVLKNLNTPAQESCGGMDEVLADEGIWDSIKGFGSKISESFKGLFEDDSMLGGIWDSIKGFGTTLFDGIGGLFSGDEGLGGMMKGAGTGLMDMLKGAGTGLMGMFSGFSMPWGAARGGYAEFSKGGFAKFAEGGSVLGAGGPTSDSIPAWLSNGEYVINAAATAEYRPIIEAINAGELAKGGFAKFSKGGFAKFSEGGISSVESAMLSGDTLGSIAPIAQPANKASSGSSTNTVNVTVNVSSAGNSVNVEDSEGDVEKSRALGDMIGLKIQQQLIEEQKPGGLLSEY